MWKIVETKKCCLVNRCYWEGGQSTIKLMCYHLKQNYDHESIINKFCWTILPHGCLIMNDAMHWGWALVYIYYIKTMNVEEPIISVSNRRQPNMEHFISSHGNTLLTTWTYNLQARNHEVLQSNQWKSWFGQRLDPSTLKVDTKFRFAREKVLSP